MSTDTPLLEDPDAMYSALWVAVGVMILFVARRGYGMLLEGGLPGVILITQLFVTGIGIIALAATGLVDLRRWARPLAFWILYTLLALSLFMFLVMAPDHYSSDVSLFESWASHLLLQGKNPMDASMLAAHQAWPMANSSANVTATTNGGLVDSYSYPGGTLWISSIEQAILPGNRLGVVNVLAAIGLFAWLTTRVQDGLIPLVLLAVMAPVLRPISAAWGMITPLWLFPLAIGLAAWYDDRLDTAAIMIGLAIAGKQLAWPIAGLVLIHVLRTHGQRSGVRFAGIAGLTAGVIVGPYILWDPTAWAYSALSVFLPFGPELVAQGVGLTSLTVGNVTTIPRPLHTLLVALTATGLIWATWRDPQRMQYVIPFGTIIVMLVHYRTLPSYYALTVPLAVLVLDTRLRHTTKGRVIQV